MTDFGVQLPDFFNAAQQLNGGHFWKDQTQFHQPVNNQSPCRGQQQQAEEL